MEKGFILLAKRAKVFYKQAMKRSPPSIIKKAHRQHLDKDIESIILGIDPGTRITGYGVIKTHANHHIAMDYGCIRPPVKEDLHKRYLTIFRGVLSLIKKHQPVAVAVESQFVNKNAQSALKLGMAKGAVIIAAASLDIPVFEYAPKKAKLAVVGNGRASKEQVQRMVQVILNLPKLPTPEDAADGLALAICHAHETRFQKRILSHV